MIFLRSYIIANSIIIFLLLSSCINNSDKNIGYGEKIYASSFKHMRAEPAIDLITKPGRFQSIVVVDSFLVCVNYFDKNVLHILSVKSHKYLGSFLNRGKEKGECLSVSAIIPIKKSEFWAYDITLNKLLKINLSKAINNQKYNPEEEIILNGNVKGLKSPVRLNDSLFSACSYFNDSSRYLVFDKNSKIHQFIGALPLMNDKWPQANSAGKFALKAMVFSANLVKHPFEDSILVFYNRMDRIDSYINSAYKKTITGPDFYEPIYKFVTSSNGITIPKSSEDTWYTYVQATSCKDYAMALYSGKNKEQSSANLIMVFSWSGKPITKIELNEQVDCIAPDVKGNNINGFFALNQSGRIVYIPIRDKYNYL